LPAFGFLFIWASSAAPPLAALSTFYHEKGWRHTARLLRAIVPILLTWIVMSSMWIFPHSMSYFNELAGGPLNGHRYLLDSNIDWGQDLYYLRDWVERNPGARPLKIEYHGRYSPHLVGLQEDALSKRPGDGPADLIYYAISLNKLYGYRTVREGIPDFVRPSNAPIARAGYSIYIYRVSNRSSEVPH
jgi:hypothetical protein